MSCVDGWEGWGDEGGENNGKLYHIACGRKQG